MATEFYSRFNASKSQLLDRISEIKTPQDKTDCLQSLTELSQECKRALFYLPQHDQETYNSELQSLADSIEKASVAKPKFSFKSRSRKPAETGPKRPPIEKEQSTTVQEDDHASKNDITEVHSISNLKNSNYAEPSSFSNLKIADVDNCTISLHSSTYKVAKLDNVHRSTIFVQAVEGPIYLTNIADSTIVVGCHQFRMHQSSDVRVYISCLSKRPIIEKCHGILFGLFPDSLMPLSKDDTQQRQKSVAFDTVDDFNWIRRTQSINWARMETTEDLAWLFDLQTGDKKLENN